MRYSLIIPVFNRPQEVQELLATIAAQTYRDFEVIVVEDGSSLPAEEVVKQFASTLALQYYCKAHSGPGPARNYGCQQAHGEYFIFLDSDCLLPPHYLETVHRALCTTAFDAFGGPDAAHPSFTPLQKAISYALTSFFTTGGIRGGRNHLGRFQPRSFNMGMSRHAYERTGGFTAMRFGEDIELSLRMMKCGLRVGLIPDAFVYHKRRATLWQFFKQVHNAGVARINLYKRHPEALQLVHWLPAVFTLSCVGAFPIGALTPRVGILLATAILTYLALIGADATRQYRSLTVGLLSAIATCVQFIGYGSGFLRAVWKRLILGQGEFFAFQRTFYA
ncbi:MAG: glycosyltransferase [Candidatus Binatia bacterium]|nr:glycosyltransferase [Candidatus Binatia bacterium]